MGNAEGNNAAEIAASVINGWELDHGVKDLHSWERGLAGEMGAITAKDLSDAGTPVLRVEQGKISGRTWTCVLHDGGVDLLALSAKEGRVLRRFLGRPPDLDYREELVGDGRARLTAVVVGARGLDEPIRVELSDEERAEAKDAIDLLRRWARSDITAP